MLPFALGITDTNRNQRVNAMPPSPSQAMLPPSPSQTVFYSEADDGKSEAAPFSGLDLEAEGGDEHDEPAM
jgi:hypothetical protein